MKFLGIDGGGSKTTFLLVDEKGIEITQVQSGASNWLSVGQEAAAQAIREGLESIRPHKPDVVCGGFAGAGRPEGLQFYSSLLTPLLPQSRVMIETDAEIAYAGAIGLRAGVLLIAGTGSIAVGQRADGSMVRVGGWGPHFGDEGGGFWIGREAIRSALRSIDAGAPPGLAAWMAEILGLKSLRDVPAAWGAGSLRVPDIARLFPEIASMYPNEPAATILRSAAAELRSLVEVAKVQVGVPDCPVSASGSVATSPIIQQLLGLPITPAIASPERGAILLARTQQPGSGPSGSILCS